jgi:hypothetical protein
MEPNRQAGGHLLVRQGAITYQIERSEATRRLACRYDGADPIMWGRMPIAVRKAAREFFGLSSDRPAACRPT